MALESATRRRRRWIRLAVAGGLIGLALAVLLLKHTPAVYERTAPLGSDRDAVRAFNRQVVNHVGNVLLDESGGTRLDLVVTEAMLNARIAQFLEEERRGGRPVPAVLAHLRVGFEPGAVVLATRLGNGWSEIVAGQWLHLSADGRGRLRAEPAGATAGSLPLPAGLLGLLRTSVADGLALKDDAGAPSHDEAETDEAKRLRIVDAVLDALEGEPVAFGKGERRIILESVEVDRGVLRMQGRRAEE